MSATIDDESDRHYWEKRILEAADNIPVERPDWVDSKELTHFIDTWHDLKNFYAEHGDTVIGLEALHEYNNFMRLLREIVCDEKQKVSVRERAKDRLDGLEWAVESVISEAVSNFYADEE